MGKKSSRFNHNAVVSVGVDVSKKDLHISLIDRDHQVYRDCILNQREAIEAWVQQLVQAEYCGLIIVESTARYHYLLAWRLSEAGMDVRVINPLLSSKYLKGQVRKTKTDRADADVLAWMGLTEPKLPAPVCVTQKQLQIRQKMGLLQSLEKQIQSLSQMLSDYEASCNQLGLELSEAEQGMQKLLKQFQAQRQKLLSELEQLMKAVEYSQEDMARLESLPGFSQVVCQLVLTFLRTDVKSAKSWQAYVGFDISVKQSGIYRGRGRLTKRGNPYLRKRLYCAAWGAYMHYSEVREYYDWLKKQGRCHKEALVIIARKLLGMAFALIKNKTYYDSKVAFCIN